MIVADARGKPPNLTFAVAALPGCQWGPTTMKKTLTPVDILIPHCRILA
jgi:hypothetical protein